MITLQVTNLTKRFGKKIVLRPLNVQLSPGITGIQGPNGSGKSTFLRIITYLVAPTSGNFHWKNNEKILEPRQVKYNLGYAAPYMNAYDELTVHENLKFFQKSRPNRIQTEEIEFWLEKASLTSLQHQSYGSLSSGQQQRVRLLTAVLGNPSILILDEPGTNLDTKGDTFVQFLLDEFSSRKAFILLASNRKEELDWCTRHFSVTTNE